MNARFNLKCALTFDVRMLCLSFQSWLCVTEWAWPLLSAIKLRPMNCTFKAYEVFFMNFRRVYCRGAMNRSWAAKLGCCSHYATSSLRHLEMCSHLEYNGYLMIQKQITLKVYNVWKLHRPSLSHCLLADNVETTLARLLYSSTTDVVFIEVHDQWASPEIRA